MCGVYAGLLVVAELVLYGAFRLGVVSSFSVWRAPAQLLPTWLLLGWWGARQAGRPVVACSLRAAAQPDQQPRPWRSGQGRLAAGLLTFTRGAVGGTVPVPPGPDETLRVEAVDLVRPPSLDGVFWALRSVVVALRGPDGDHELKIAAQDVDKVRTLLVPSVGPSGR